MHSCTDQYLHCEVSDGAGKMLWWMIVIYASNLLADRKLLWKDIATLASNIQGQWMILGDFNNVLNTPDRIGGDRVQENEYPDLEEMMIQQGLFEHETIGVHFTWTNKHTSNTIYSRIDRVVCNKEWFMAFLNCEVEVLNAHISDHNPLKIKPYGHQRRR